MRAYPFYMASQIFPRVGYRAYNETPYRKDQPHEHLQIHDGDPQARNPTRLRLARQIPEGIYRFQNLVPRRHEDGHSCNQRNCQAATRTPREALRHPGHHRDRRAPVHLEETIQELISKQGPLTRVLVFSWGG